MTSQHSDSDCISLVDSEAASDASEFELDLENLPRLSSSKTNESTQLQVSAVLVHAEDPGVSSNSSIPASNTNVTSSSSNSGVSVVGGNTQPVVIIDVEPDSPVPLSNKSTHQTCAAATVQESQSSSLAAVASEPPQASIVAATENESVAVNQVQESVSSDQHQTTAPSGGRQTTAPSGDHQTTVTQTENDKDEPTATTNETDTATQDITSCPSLVNTNSVVVVDMDLASVEPSAHQPDDHRNSTASRESDSGINSNASSCVDLTCSPAPRSNSNRNSVTSPGVVVMNKSVLSDGEPEDGGPSKIALLAAALDSESEDDLLETSFLGGGSRVENSSVAPSIPQLSGRKRGLPDSNMQNSSRQPLDDISSADSANPSIPRPTKSARQTQPAKTREPKQLKTKPVTQRQKDQIEKKRIKLVAAQQKCLKKVLHKVNLGEFALQEISVHVETSLYEQTNGQIGQALTMGGFRPPQSAICPVPGGIWYTRVPWRTDECDQSTKTPIPKPESEYTMNYMTIVWKGTDFARIIATRSFVELIEVVKAAFQFLDCKRQMENAKDEEKVITMIVEGMDNAVNALSVNRLKSHRRNSPSAAHSLHVTPNDIQRTVNWLYATAQVHTVFVASHDATCDQIYKLLKGRAEGHYVKDLTPVDLAPTHKIVQNEMDHIRDSSGELAERTMLRCIWHNQLRCIPRMSASQASRIVERYPTFRKLHDKYQSNQLTFSEKRYLLSSLSVNKKYAISTSVHQHFTSTNSQEKIGDA